jgi:catechol 2,3-dioxygenase-like lactoylglutathione lyase family enzyme
MDSARRKATARLLGTAAAPWLAAGGAQGQVTTGPASPAQVGEAPAAPVDTPFGPPRVDAGWAEAVVVVSDLSRMVAVLDAVAGWQPVWRGTTPAAVLALWGLPAGASGSEVLLANPGDQAGFVRLVHLKGAGAQQQIRSSAMPWDTGGVFSLMTRARDLDGAFRRAQALGYSAYNDPTDFDFGGVVLRNVVLRLPDGLNLAIYERRQPLLAGWSTIRKLSAPFNAMQMVPDRDRTRDFWRTVFGYVPLAEGDFLDRAPGPNNFALPHNLTTRIERRYAIMAIAGSETGRVEAMQFAGLTGRDLSAQARFPNLGIAALRWPTARLEERLQRARAAGHATSAATVTAELQPHGPVRLAQVRSPDGVMIELMAPA